MKLKLTLVRDPSKQWLKLVKKFEVLIQGKKKKKTKKERIIFLSLSSQAVTL